MKRVSILFCLCLLVSTYSFAQKITSISGEIFSKHTNDYLSYASVTIKGFPIWTVANDLGQFTLHFSESMTDDTLCITSLGYKTFVKPIRSIFEDSISKFYLDTINIPIQPVYVLSKGETADQIVGKAIKNIKKNYPNKMYYLDAFYRELSMRDNKYARLIEAAISIQDYGFDTDLKATKLKVEELRKSNSYLEYDTKSKISKKFLGERNMILTTYCSDFVRAKQNCSYTNFLCKENLERFEFSLTGCTYNDKELVYLINFRDTLGDSQTHKKTANFEGTLYIQSGNYAIIKLDYGLVAVNERPHPLFFKGKYFVYTSISYKIYNGKYYPDVIQTIDPVTGAFVTNPSDSVLGRQYILSTLMINNIKTRRKEFSKIKNKEKEFFNIDIYEKQYPYNPEFWKNYNIILLNPNTKSVNADLQRETPLEVQFINNGK